MLQLNHCTTSNNLSFPEFFSCFLANQLWPAKRQRNLRVWQLWKWCIYKNMNYAAHCLELITVVLILPPVTYMYTCTHRAHIQWRLLSPGLHAHTHIHTHGWHYKQLVLVSVHACNWCRYACNWIIIIIMDICKAPTLWLKALNKHTHIMYIEMENVI